MTRRAGRPIVGALVIVACATPAGAVDPGTVDRYVSLSDAFHSRLAQSPVAGLSPAARRARAVCILTRMEEGAGAEGVAALLELASVLSRGAEFDDPTIIAFNRRYGALYRSADTQCTRAAGG